MNILLINHYAGSPKHGMEYRPFYLAREWVKLGHQVTIVGASQSHLRSKQPDTKGNITKQQIEGIRYVWLKTPSYRGNGMGRVLNMLTFIMRLFLFSSRIIAGCKPDCVIASSTYPLDIYPARYIARRNKAKLIYEVHDLWPLSPIELGGMSPWHPFIMVMQMAENFAYCVSDRVVSMLPKAADHMREHGMVSEKFSYVPNGIDINEWEGLRGFLPEEHNTILSNLRKKDQFIVGYAGSHGVSNALHYFIEAAALVKGQSVSFVLVGQGPEKEELQIQAMDLGISNIVFLPAVSKSAISTLLDFMDILYIGWNRIPIYRFGISPNKLFDYMMAGKPVIHGIEAGNDLVAESGCGISIPPENPEAIATAIIKLKNMTQAERVGMGLKGREYVMKNHDYKILAKKFIAVMNHSGA